MSIEPDQRNSPTEEGGGPPYRAIAMVLLTAVVVAVAIGMVQLFSDDDSSADEEQVATSEQNGAGAESDDALVPESEDGGAVAPGEGADDPAAGDPAPGAPEDGIDDGEAADAPEPAPAPGGPQSVPVTVYNNSTVQGLASQTGDQVRGAGFNVVDTTNLASDLGVVPSSTAMYGPAPGEQEAAEALAAEFGFQVAPKPANLELEPGVAVIVTQ